MKRNKDSARLQFGTGGVCGDAAALIQPYILFHSNFNEVMVRVKARASLFFFCFHVL